MYMSITLRNVNLWSRSKCQFTLTPNITLHNIKTTFLGNGGQGGQHGWPFAMHTFAESSA